MSPWSPPTLRRQFAMSPWSPPNVPLVPPAVLAPCHLNGRMSDKPGRIGKPARDPSRILSHYLGNVNVAAGRTSGEIAECLNREGFRPPSNPAGRFTPERARDLVYRLGLSPRRRPSEHLAADEWWVRDLADAARRGIRPIQGMGQEGLCPRPTRREPEASGDLGRCGGARTAPPAPGRFPSRPDEPLSP